MDLAYVAHTDSCALLLDGDGVCRWVVPKSGGQQRELATARRCVGAQFVATLDRDIDGLLGHEPAAGKTLLFGTSKDGRISLLRFGPISAFETLGESPSVPTASLTPEPAAPTRRADESWLATLSAFSEAPVPTTEEAPPMSMSTSTSTSSSALPLPPRVPTIIAGPPPVPVPLPLPAPLPARAVPLQEPSEPRDTLRDDATPPAKNADVALEALMAPDAPAAEGGSSNGSPAIASFLKEVAALTESPYSKALDANDIEDLHTGSFGSLSVPISMPIHVRRTLESPPAVTRESPLPAVTRESPAARSNDEDSELDITTGAFARASDRHLGMLAELIEAGEIEHARSGSWRQSGFIRRLPDAASAPESTLDNEDETLRFARAEGRIRLQ